MGIEYDFYFQSRLLLEARANPDAVNNGGYTALTGAEGGKTGADAWDAPVTILNAAEDNPEHLEIAFKALEEAGPTTIDKASLAMVGMRKKRECKGNWNGERFAAIVRRQ